MSSGGVVPATSQLRPRPLCPRLGWAGLGWADKIVPAQHTQSPAARCQHTTGHTARPGPGRMEPRSVRCCSAASPHATHCSTSHCHCSTGIPAGQPLPTAYTHHCTALSPPRQQRREWGSGTLVTRLHHPHSV